MNNSKLSIGIFGTFQNGKSTLVNCLANSDIALVGGEGVSVTHTNVRYTYGDSKDVIIITNDDNRISVPLSQYFNNPNGFSAREIVVESKCPTLEYFDIIDTPGFNANDSDTFLAERIIKEIDFAILLVRNKGISQNEKGIAFNLSENNIPFTCVVNCFDDIFDNWNPLTEQNDSIKRSILADLQTNDCNPISNFNIKPIYVVNLMWFWLSLGHTSQNNSISLSNRKVHKFWEELIGESSYSATKLKRASRVESLLKVFKNKKMILYLKALEHTKIAYKKCTLSVGWQDDFMHIKTRIINSICNEISANIENDKDAVVNKLDKIKTIQKENEGLSIFSLSDIIKMTCNAILRPIETEAELRYRLGYLDLKEKKLLSFIKCL